jgi:hypothetical protein
MLRGRRLQRGVATFAVALAVCLGQARVSQGGDRCVEPPAKGVRWAWPKNSDVRVNISPDFSPLTGARQAVESAFENWQEANGPDGNGSEVRFTFTYDPTPASSAGTFQVSYGTVRGSAQARTLLRGKRGGLLNALCTIDSRVTAPAAVANAMAHEIGHTFGLGECDECPSGGSVMTRYSGDYNDTLNGRSGPSRCDNAVVRANGGY